MLQRLTEDFEYADILDVASKCEDPFERLAYVAAFTVSSYSTTSTRSSKPFNPLLGETYECDRLDDLGWKAISEQVGRFFHTLLISFVDWELIIGEYRCPIILPSLLNIAKVKIGLVGKNSQCLRNFVENICKLLRLVLHI